MSLLHSVLFYILHFIIRSVLTLLDYAEFIYRRTVKLIMITFTIAPTEIELLANAKVRASQFSKLPKHIGLVFNEDCIILTQVAKIIVWCIAIGIDDISIFDCDDYLKTESAALLRIVKETIERTSIPPILPKLLFHSSGPNGFSPSSQHDMKTKSFPDSHIVISTHNSVNETESYGVNVVLVSSSDGRTAITEAAKAICKKVQDKTFNPKGLTKSIFRKNLHVLQGADPDLLLCFGRGNTLAGYPPWNIHLSEISFHSTHTRFELCHFMDSLGIFNKCEQRFGK